MRAVLPLATAAALLAAPACSGHDHGDDDQTYDCALDDRDEEFLAGMEKVGDQGVTFRLVSSAPTPPARGDNAWVLELEQGGAALAGATVRVTPFMPDHRHGTPIVAEIEEDAQAPGRYDVAPVNLFMPGLWEITIEATPDGGTTQDRDRVVFRFCIPG